MAHKEVVRRKVVDVALHRSAPTDGTLRFIVSLPLSPTMPMELATFSFMIVRLDLLNAFRSLTRGNKYPENHLVMRTVRLGQTPPMVPLSAQMGASPSLTVLRPTSFLATIGTTLANPILMCFCAIAGMQLESVHSARHVALNRRPRPDGPLSQADYLSRPMIRLTTACRWPHRLALNWSALRSLIDRNRPTFSLGYQLRRFWRTLAQPPVFFMGS